MIKTPMCSWDRHKNFKLATIPEVFVIPDFQRVLTEAHKSGIADAIRIHVAAEQIEAPEYTTRGGRIVG